MPKEKLVEEVLEEEILEDEDVLENGPDEETIEELKGLTNGELYATRIIDQLFLWRPLKRKEYKDILNIENADTHFREERIADKCVVWPKNKSELIRNGRAGYATILFDVISSESGFTRDVQSIKL